MKKKLQVTSYRLQVGRNLGFTLLELLVVIAIIAILVALGTVSYSTAQKRSRDSRVHSDIKEIQNALESYYSINSSSYPVTASIGDLDSETYFSSASRPKDPKTGNDYPNYASDGTSYCLCSNALEIAGTGNASDDDCTFAAAGNYFCVKNLQ
ncbi:hypothetical protein A2160_05985 [Candidatus Beckwithbacteria bacterium RBG_13_42_9]|uniref:Type II secretion system protein GspG C-terminal domain-containing protein n=1 Tax=Candidatus Beckwithbacteria bacterium RBG_13_42_9 TaxID=1797457 RepID=A0A1F5E5N2_9BACT|nr:MAG: hypothetical protein A2160_05985 [Candidatus Beckwithbacteria bacterium RBG_13_42_9]